MTDWGRVGAISGVVGAVAAVVALVPQLLSAGGAPPTSPAAPTAPPSERTPSPQPGWGPATAPAALCAAEDGQPASCLDVGAGLVVATERCTPADAARTLGIDPALRQLDLSADLIDGRCLLRPGAVAQRAGASAEDIRRLPASESATILSLCFATSAGPEVSCSSPHTIEYVGPWLDQAQEPAAVCDDAARRYTNRTFDSATEELEVVILTAPGQYRCAVEAPERLTSSLWRIGGAPIR